MLFLQAGRGLNRHTGLAHPTGSDQCDQAAGGYRFSHLFQFDVTPEEAAQWFWGRLLWAPTAAPAHGEPAIARRRGDGS